MFIHNIPVTLCGYQKGTAAILNLFQKWVIIGKKLENISLKVHVQGAPQNFIDICHGFRNGNGAHW